MEDATRDLNDRETAVLSALVRMHIDSKEPVGSKVLAASLDERLSSATIRSVMSALSERGLIAQPHPSAGRVPTDRGVRFYIDSVLQLAPASPEEEGTILTRIHEASSLDSAAVEASRVLSRLSQQVCVLRAPRPERARLAHLDLVRLRDDAVMCILVSEAGQVHNRVIELGPLLKERLGGRRLVDEEIAEYGRTLSELARGRTLPELRQAVADRVAKERKEAIELLEAIVGDALDVPADEALPVVVAGGSHLLEAADARGPTDRDALARLREVYSLLEEQRRLLELLERAEAAPGVRIFVGQESGVGELEEMSLVTATYGRGGDILGSVGVLGPRHMDYARVVPLVTVTAQAVSGLFTS